MKAYIEGVKAIKEVDANVLFLTSEPLVNMVPPLNATAEQIAKAAVQHEHQFQVTDILCGRMCPELGGRPEYVDMIGVNYYYNNQWVYDSFNFLIWKGNPPDIRWKRLASLVSEVYNRYKKPVVITETSHPKEDRPLWINMIGEECAALMKANIPLHGICIYPIIDRPDWDDLTTWHHSGLWDINDNSLKRILYQPMARALLLAQQETNILLPESCGVPASF